MAISVPVVILLQIGSIIGFFFSTDDEARQTAFESILKFGISYNLFLVVFPFVTIFLACTVPGPKPEKFGEGSLRIKTSLVMFSAVALATGTVVRAYSIFNPRPPTTTDVLYGKPVFYTTQFMIEIIIVVMYALLRFDLLFHIPNGSSGPGDYSAGKYNDTEKARLLSREDIEDHIASFQIPHQILKASYTQSTVTTGSEHPIYAVFFPKAPEVPAMPPAGSNQLPPRPVGRVSRRESYRQGVKKTVSRTRVSMNSSMSGSMRGPNEYRPESRSRSDSKQPAPRQGSSQPQRPHRDAKTMYSTGETEPPPRRSPNSRGSTEKSLPRALPPGYKTQH